ncbi:YsnF/AvaK domain-containing protein [uncultured Pseudokineococcus sp.]|uniref:YsnF/AvaK domain-containing protein n=1 Tax=uncultured Pseudokineococcus sp. TaxID=1642928 RepID=UPI00260331C7|nr:YsnF/AvaK domain-containing protein [uncultured Pseudokineococcus sp.]
MSGITDQQLTGLYEATVISETDGKVGKVTTVYLDDDTQQPSWVTVKTALVAGASSFVPLDQATLSGDELRVPYGKDMIKDAPDLDDDSDLSPAQERDLYRYYGLSDQPLSDPSGLDDRDHSPAGSEDRDGGSMTLSEEQVSVDTQTRESGRARLRRHVVTERVSQDVPVSHEEVVIEREPITAGDRGDALSGGELTEEEHEVTLHEERAVVETETVPVERVRLGTKTVTDTETVSTDVRHEELEVDEGASGTDDGSGR